MRKILRAVPMQRLRACAEQTPTVVYRSPEMPQTLNFRVDQLVSEHRREFRVDRLQMYLKVDYLDDIASVFDK